MTLSLPFPSAPRARANLKPGSTFAIDGEDGFIYFGQIGVTAMVGFFRYRSQEVVADEVLAMPLMSCFGVQLPSIGQALRAGKWLQLGLYPVHPELRAEPVLVQWPVGTLDVVLWRGNVEVGTTKVHDPEIQSLEVVAAFDAIYHVPHRLRADFADDKDDWLAGGTVRRHRLQKEAMAKKYPEQPWHQLPPEWMPVEC